MAKKLTAAQKARKTREAKNKRALEELGFERGKVKRKRKPMTAEQKKAAVERLAKAREARGAMVVSLSVKTYEIYQKITFCIGRRSSNG